MQGYKIIGFVPISRVPGKGPDRRMKFTGEEKQFIRDNWHDMSDRELARQLRRSPGGVTSVRKSMGLTRYKRNE